MGQGLRLELGLDNKNGHFHLNIIFKSMQKRSPEYYKVVKAQTERFGNSAIPSMIKMLNDCQSKKSDTFKVKVG